MLAKATESPHLGGDDRHFITASDPTLGGYVRASNIGRQSHQVIALAATGQLGVAAAGQIRLAVVTGDKSGAVPAVLADGRCDPHADCGY